MNKTKADDEVPEKLYTQAELDEVVTPLNDKIFKMKLAMSSQAMYVRFIMMDLVNIILKRRSLRKLVANAFSHTIDFMARGREFWDDHDRVSFKKVSQDLSDAIDVEAGRKNLCDVKEDKPVEKEVKQVDGLDVVVSRLDSLITANTVCFGLSFVILFFQVMLLVGVFNK